MPLGLTKLAAGIQGGVDGAGGPVVIPKKPRNKFSLNKHYAELYQQIEGMDMFTRKDGDPAGLSTARKNFGASQQVHQQVSRYGEGACEGEAGASATEQGDWKADTAARLGKYRYDPNRPAPTDGTKSNSSDTGTHHSDIAVGRSGISAPNKQAEEGRMSLEEFVENLGAPSARRGPNLPSWLDDVIFPSTPALATSATFAPNQLSSSSDPFVGTPPASSAHTALASSSHAQHPPSSCTTPYVPPLRQGEDPARDHRKGGMQYGEAGGRGRDERWDMDDGRWHAELGSRDGPSHPRGGTSQGPWYPAFHPNPAGSGQGYTSGFDAGQGGKAYMRPFDPASGGDHGQTRFLPADDRNVDTDPRDWRDNAGTGDAQYGHGHGHSHDRSWNRPPHNIPGDTPAWNHDPPLHPSDEEASAFRFGQHPHPQDYGPGHGPFFPPQYPPPAMAAQAHRPYYAHNGHPPPHHNIFPSLTGNSGWYWYESPAGQLQPPHSVNPHAGGAYQSWSHPISTRPYPPHAALWPPIPGGVYNPRAPHQWHQAYPPDAVPPHAPPFPQAHPEQIYSPDLQGSALSTEPHSPDLLNQPVHPAMAPGDTNLMGGTVPTDLGGVPLSLSQVHRDIHLDSTAEDAVEGSEDPDAYEQKDRYEKGRDEDEDMPDAAWQAFVAARDKSKASSTRDGSGVKGDRVEQVSDANRRTDRNKNGRYATTGQAMRRERHTEGDGSGPQSRDSQQHATPKRKRPSGSKEEEAREAKRREREDRARMEQREKQNRNRARATAQHEAARADRHAQSDRVSQHQAREQRRDRPRQLQQDTVARKAASAAAGCSTPNKHNARPVAGGNTPSKGSARDRKRKRENGDDTHSTAPTRSGFAREHISGPTKQRHDHRDRENGPRPLKANPSGRSPHRRDSKVSAPDQSPVTPLRSALKQPSSSEERAIKRARKTRFDLPDLDVSEGSDGADGSGDEGDEVVIDTPSKRGPINKRPQGSVLRSGKRASRVDSANEESMTARQPRQSSSQAMTAARGRSATGTQISSGVDNIAGDAAPRQQHLDVDCDPSGQDGPHDDHCGFGDIIPAPPAPRTQHALHQVPHGQRPVGERLHPQHRNDSGDAFQTSTDQAAGDQGASSAEYSPSPSPMGYVKLTDAVPTTYDLPAGAVPALPFKPSKPRRQPGLVPRPPPGVHMSYAINDDTPSAVGTRVDGSTTRGELIPNLPIDQRPRNALGQFLPYVAGRSPDLDGRGKDGEEEVDMEEIGEFPSQSQSQTLSQTLSPSPRDQQQPWVHVSQLQTPSYELEDDREDEYDHRDDRKHHHSQGNVGRSRGSGQGPGSTRTGRLEVQMLTPVKEADEDELDDDDADDGGKERAEEDMLADEEDKGGEWSGSRTQAVSTRGQAAPTNQSRFPHSTSSARSRTLQAPVNQFKDNSHALHQDSDRGNGVHPQELDGDRHSQTTSQTPTAQAHQHQPRQSQGQAPGPQQRPRASNSNSKAEEAYEGTGFGEGFFEQSDGNGFAVWRDEY